MEITTDNLIEVFGVLSGLLYLYLEIKQHDAMWIVGFVTSLLYVSIFFTSKFYADMGLQLYYVSISVYGFWLWHKRKKGKRGNPETKGESHIKYQRLTTKLSLRIGLASVIFYLLTAYILRMHTDSPVPYGDALTTALSIVATWMLARRILEHWLFWIVINLISVYLYWMRGLNFTLFLYLCYGIFSWIGYQEWKKKGVKYDHID